MRNEDRVNTNTIQQIRQPRRQPRRQPKRRRQRRQIDWDGIVENLIFGFVVLIVLAGVVSLFVWLGMAMSNSQSSYDVEFCNLSQSNIDYLMNGSTNDPTINCSITEQWFAVTTVTCKTKGFQNDVTEFINMGNMSCWRYKDN